MRLTHALATTGLVAGLLAGCGGADPSGATATDGPANAPNPDTRTGAPEAPAGGESLQVTETLTGLTTPWGLAPLADGGLLIGSRDDATISLVPAGGGEPVEVGSVDDVRVEGEAGLLGLALTEDEKLLYAFRTGASTNSVVRMAWDGTRLGPPEQVFTGIPGGASFHQGGAMLIADGLLHVGTGDNGTPPNAQDPDSLSGKVLRLTLDGEPAPGNPGGTPVFSLGHRNVEGLVLDDDGSLWESEFGQDRFDELNLIEAGGNYGWPEVEGTGGGSDYVDPAAVWSTDDASPSGIAWWDGSLWLAALKGERLWEVVPGAAPAVEAPVAHLSGRYGRIRDAVASADGSTLWVVTSNTDGRGEPDAEDDRLLSITR